MQIKVESIRWRLRFPCKKSSKTFPGLFPDPISLPSWQKIKVKPINWDTLTKEKQQLQNLHLCSLGFLGLSHPFWGPPKVVYLPPSRTLQWNKCVVYRVHSKLSNCLHTLALLCAKQTWHHSTSEVPWLSHISGPKANILLLSEGDFSQHPRLLDPHRLPEEAQRRSWGCTWLGFEHLHQARLLSMICLTHL